MIRDTVESVAEIIYVNEMERTEMPYDSWDSLAENVKEVYIRTAEEVLDIVDEESFEGDVDTLLIDDWDE